MQPHRTIHAIYDSLPVSANRNLIGHRPSVLRAFATVVGVFAISTIAYRVVVPLESASSAEQWLLLKHGAEYSKLFQAMARPSTNPAQGDPDSIPAGVSKQNLEVQVVRRLMRVAASHIRTKPTQHKVRNKHSDGIFPSSDQLIS